jgi:hypothetical protein
MPELNVAAETVAFLIEKTREFDVKEGATDPDSGSNATDDNMIDVLEDGGDAVAQEISALVNALAEEERVDLVALMRLGRGDGTFEEWDELWRTTRDTLDRPAARILLDEPLVSDYLAEGLNAFGIDWTDVAPE